MSTEKFVSIDCGKYNTKVAFYDKENKEVKKCKFRTKVSPGSFEDDMFDKGTYIVQIDDGKIYTVGYNGKQEPKMETSKNTEIHRVCTMTGIALALGEGEHSMVNAVIGIPFQLAYNIEERISYKNFILGEENKIHTIKIKTEPEGKVHEVKFKFKDRKVFPEGIGIIYEYPVRLDGPTAIIDIGNLNINNIYADKYNLIVDSCFTDELGGKILISGLAQELTSELGARVDDSLVASTLIRPYEKRYLRPVNNDEKIKKRSKEIIDEYLLSHVQAIRKKCDTRHYPLSFMNIVCVGGTSKLLKHEIMEVFGENTFIPNNPEYVNVLGCLRKLCADHNIDLDAKTEEK